MSKRSVSLIILVLFLIFPTTVFAQRGCCSHHGGVAGCSSSGRQICNDGTLSPSCTCTPVVKKPVVKTVYGCMDKTAKNYNKKATKDDGSCKYYVLGCTNKDAINYNEKAEKDDGNCILKVYGCMDKSAKNYNALANTEDNTCKYESINTVINNKETKKEEKAEDGNIYPLLAFPVIGSIIAFVYTKTRKKKI